MKKIKKVIIALVIFLMVAAIVGVFASVIKPSEEPTKEACVHEYTAWREEAASCTANGTLCRTCALCGVKQVQYTKPLGHDVVYHEAKEYTCDEIGWSAYETCSRCDYTTYEEIPANHRTQTFVENYVESVCWQVGSFDEETMCMECGEYLSIVTHMLEPVPHTPDEIIRYDFKEKTCTEDGGYGEMIRCLVCDTVLYDQKYIFEAEGHDYEVDIVLYPTCIDTGTAIYSCTNCNYMTERTILADGHQYEHSSSVCSVCDTNAADGLTYQLSADGTYYIVTGMGTYTGTYVSIPPAIDGIPVKEIGEKAFNGNTNILRVDLPSSIEVVGLAAFENCRNAQINLPYGLRRIEKRAFLNCYMTGHELIIPETVIYVGYHAFGNNHGFTEVDFRGKPETINMEAFLTTKITTIHCNWSKYFNGSLNDNAPWGAEGASVVYSLWGW